MKREIRTFNTPLTDVTTVEKEGKRYIVGLIPYDSLSVDLGGYYERIQRGAFNKTLSDGFDVKALLNHDDSKILGRVKNGTLKLEDTADGLRCTLEVGNQSYANDLWESNTRNDVNTMSFGFRVIKDDWKVDGGNKYRSLNEVSLLEVSFGVTFPAYQETVSQTVLRSIFEKRGLNFDEFSKICEKTDTNYSESEKEILQIVRSVIDELLAPKVEPSTENVQEVNLDSFYQELDLLMKTI